MYPEDPDSLDIDVLGEEALSKAGRLDPEELDFIRLMPLTDEEMDNEEL